jgi:hypothetical protein
MAMNRKRPKNSEDLLPSERRLLGAMQWIRFGRFEFIPIHNHELVLEPWPKTVSQVRFGLEDALPAKRLPEQYELHRQVVELFTYVRSVETGEILCLQVRHGIPVVMEIRRPDEYGGDGG